MIRPELDDNDLNTQAFAFDAAFRQVGVELQQAGAGAASQAIGKLQGLLRLMEKLRAAASLSQGPSRLNGEAESMAPPPA